MCLSHFMPWSVDLVGDTGLMRGIRQPGKAEMATEKEVAVVKLAPVAAASCFFLKRIKGI